MWRYFTAATAAFHEFPGKFPVANASIPDLPAKRMSLKLDGNDTGTSHILRSLCVG